VQQLLEFGYFHADPHPGNLFALPGKTGAMGHLAYVDFGMMDSISDSDRLTLTGAVVHLINRDFASLAKDFVDLGFLNPNTDLTPIVPALEEVLGGALGDNVGSFNFKAITDRFSELMYAYPFRVPARFALIIRAVGGPTARSQLPHHPRGLSLRGQAAAGGRHRRNAREAAGGAVR